MEAKPIIALMITLTFIAYLMPIALIALSESGDTAKNESEQLDYYNSLSDADKANYTSIYAEDGEAPTPWSTGERLLAGIIGLIIIMTLLSRIAPD